TLQPAGPNPPTSVLSRALHCRGLYKASPMCPPPPAKNPGAPASLSSDMQTPEHHEIAHLGSRRYIVLPVAVSPPGVDPCWRALCQCWSWDRPDTLFGSRFRRKPPPLDPGGIPI